MNATATEQLENARAFLNELSADPPKVPYEPELLPMLFAATREDSTASINDIARLIERSQNLASRLLNIANSAYYVLEFKVSSLSRAVSVLGLKEVRSMVLMVGMVSAIRGIKLPPGFDARGLWLHQLKTAFLARILVDTLTKEARPKRVSADNTPTMAPDEAYAAGLLHDLGKIFLASTRPRDWTNIIELQNARRCGFAEAEMDYWGMDHGIVGSRVLHTWKIPLILTDAIAWHHAPKLAPQGSIDASLLAAADTLAGQGYTAGKPFEEDVLSLLPLDVDTEILRIGLAERMEKDRSLQLAAMV